MKKIFVPVLVLTLLLSIAPLSTANEYFPDEMVLDQAIEIRDNHRIKVQDWVSKQQDDPLNKTIKYLQSKLDQQGIRQLIRHDVKKKDTVAFLAALLADTDAQKIFRRFSDNSIYIFLSDHYEVTRSGYVMVDIQDGVQEVAAQLAR